MRCYSRAVPAAAHSAADGRWICSQSGFWYASAGLSSAGLPAAGLSSAGLPAAGLSSAGISAAGLPAAGLSAAGLSSAGIPAAGLSSAGLPAAGRLSSAGRLPAAGRHGHEQPVYEQPARRRSAVSAETGRLGSYHRRRLYQPLPGSGTFAEPELDTFSESRRKGGRVQKAFRQYVR
ncbi:MAG: hypothetical protein K6B74_01485 [Ruminococcus sp.]|nr:hypothetical protein [Ruminococcus sp.]